MRIDLLLAYADLVEAALPSADYCRTNGIEYAATVPACGGVHLAEVQPDGRTFEAREGGIMAAWVEAMAEDAEQVLDVVAWPVDQPAHWWTLSGFAPALGMAASVNAASYALGGALRLHRTPLAWLQAGCEGACIVDPVAGPRWLLDVEPPRIAVEDEAHAAEVDAMRRSALATFAAPRILVPVARAA